MLPSRRDQPFSIVTVDVSAVVWQSSVPSLALRGALACIGLCDRSHELLSLIGRGNAGVMTLFSDMRLMDSSKASGDGFAALFAPSSDGQSSVVPESTGGLRDTPAAAASFRSVLDAVQPSATSKTIGNEGLPAAMPLLPETASRPTTVIDQPGVSDQESLSGAPSQLVGSYGDGGRFASKRESNKQLTTQRGPVNLSDRAADATDPSATAAFVSAARTATQNPQQAHPIHLAEGIRLPTAESTHPEEVAYQSATNRSRVVDLRLGSSPASMIAFAAEGVNPRAAAGTPEPTGVRTLIPGSGRWADASAGLSSQSSAAQATSATELSGVLARPDGHAARLSVPAPLPVGFHVAEETPLNRSGAALTQALDPSVRDLSHRRLNGLELNRPVTMQVDRGSAQAMSTQTPVQASAPVQVLDADSADLIGRRALQSSDASAVRDAALTRVDSTAGRSEPSSGGRGPSTGLEPAVGRALSATLNQAQALLAAPTLVQSPGSALSSVASGVSSQPPTLAAQQQNASFGSDRSTETSAANALQSRVELPREPDLAAVSSPTVALKAATGGLPSNGVGVVVKGMSASQRTGVALDRARLSNALSTVLGPTSQIADETEEVSAQASLAASEAAAGVRSDKPGVLSARVDSPLRPMAGATIAAAEIVEQLTARVMRARVAGGQFRLHLSPGHLGDLDLRVEMRGDSRGDATAVSIVASTPAARELLEAHAPRLRQLLQDAQIELQAFDVDSERGQSFGSGESSQQRPAERRPAESLAQLPSSSEDLAGADLVGSQNSTAVDLFA